MPDRHPHLEGLPEEAAPLPQEPHYHTLEGHLTAEAWNSQVVPMLNGGRLLDILAYHLRPEGMVNGRQDLGHVRITIERIGE